MTQLHVDVRHAGEHGIGRYSREVLARIASPYTRFDSRIRPGQLLDAVNPTRMLIGQDALLYSPGYSSGPSRCRQLLTLHDLIHLRGSRGLKPSALKFFYESVVKPAVVKAGHVMTVSNSSAQEIRVWIKSPDVTIHVTGNGCSEAFTPNGDRFSFGRPYLLYVGDLKPHKNHRVAFETLRILPELGFLIVTSKPDLARRLATESGIESRTRVATNVSDEALAGMYRGAEALLFPSILEGFGLPVAESLRSSTPVIFNAECSSVAEICGGTQFAVESRSDPHAYAAAAQMVMSSDSVQFPDLDAYDWEHVASKINMTLQRLTGETK